MSLDGLKAFGKGGIDAVKKVEQFPGWLPLYLVVFGVLIYIEPPDKITVHGKTIPLSLEILALAATFIFYKIGDALDNVIFKEMEEARKGETRKCFSRQYAIERDLACNALGIQEGGAYSVSLKLLKASEKNGYNFTVSWSNELAKFLRSMPAMLLIAGLGFCRSLPWAIGLTLGIGVAIAGYIRYKVIHIRQVYTSIHQLVQPPSGNGRTNPKLILINSNRAVLFYWQSKFVSAGLARKAGGMKTEEPKRWFQPLLHVRDKIYEHRRRQ